MVLDVLGECGGEYAAGSGTVLESGGFIVNPAKFQCPAKRLGPAVGDFEVWGWLVGYLLTSLCVGCLF